MAAPQLIYRVAIALEIAGPSTFRGATVDLPEALAVSTLGHFYTGLIVSAGAVREEMPHLYYGLASPRACVFVVDNRAETFNAGAWREAPVRAWRYDRETGELDTYYQGFVSQVVRANGRATIRCVSYDPAVMRDLLPAVVLDPAPGSPFAASGSPGAPVPVIFGESVPVRPPNASNDPTGDPGGYDYLVSHDNVYVRAVHQDIDQELPGLERLGEFTTAPGSPVLVSATRFSVSDDQSARYLYVTDGARVAGMPIRFKTTAGKGNYLYSHVKAYHTDVTPHEVEIDDPLMGAGLQWVEIAGDFLIVRGYQNVLDGLVPVPPSPGARFTAIRLFDAGDAAPMVTADNPAYPLASTQIVDVIRAIILNPIWGMSARQEQAVDEGSFTLARVVCALAGLTGAVQGALAYDGQQQAAGDVLAELAMLRGIRITQNASRAWVVTADTPPPAAARVFQLGPGVEYGTRIHRLDDHAHADLSEAVRHVVLHWSPLGRGNMRAQQWTARAYGRRTIKAVGSVGRDVHLFCPWVRSQAIAERCAHYIGEKLKGADERVSFTAGPEARDVALGEAIVVDVAMDGVSGDWIVYATEKSIAAVKIQAFRANPAAYGAPTGVITSAEPEEHETRTASGVGTNLIPNPDFSGPYRRVADSDWPDDWLEVGLAVTADPSTQVAARCFGGHYVECVASSTLPPSPHALGQLIATRTPFACPDQELLLLSFYCPQDEGVFAVLLWFDGATATTSVMPTLIRDPSDTDGNGWGRYYGRVRPPAGTRAVLPFIAFAQPGTYQVAAVQLETVGRTGRKPSPWRRHRPVPQVLTDVREVTFAGSSSYAFIGFIPAGAHVYGISSRVVEAITFGTATGMTIGTDADPIAWANGATGVGIGATTGPTQWRGGSAPTLYPTATTVYVRGRATGGGAGTIASGKLRVEVAYTRNLPARAA